MMTRTRLGAAPFEALRASLGAAVLLTGPGFAAAGAPVCGPRDALVAGLAQRFGEAVVFRGGHPTAPQVLEVLMNPETGTFTVLVTNARESCVTAAGVAGELIEFVAPPVGQPG